MILAEVREAGPEARARAPDPEFELASRASTPGTPATPGRQVGSAGSVAQLDPRLGVDRAQSPASGEALGRAGLGAGPWASGEAGRLAGPRAVDAAWSRRRGGRGGPEQPSPVAHWIFQLEPALPLTAGTYMLVPGKEWCTFGTGGVKQGEMSSGGLGCTSCVCSGASVGLSLTLKAVGASYGSTWVVGS